MTQGNGHPVVDLTVAGGVILYWIDVLSPVVAFICTLMGIAWYSYLFYTHIKNNKKP